MTAMNSLFATAVRHALEKGGFFEMLFDEEKAPAAFATILSAMVVRVIISIIKEKEIRWQG